MVNGVKVPAQGRPKCLQLTQSLRAGKKGIEIGGPSAFFRPAPQRTSGASFYEAILSALPAATVFYLLLWLSAIYLPIADDYHAVLAFTNGFIQQGGLLGRAAYILNYQHNEYKLVFESSLFAIEYLLLGHLSFGPLIWVGNAFVIPLFAILVLAFPLPSRSSLTRQLLLAPLSLLLFQLQYASTLNWAMGSLQNLPVLVFALASLLLLSKDKPLRFPGACCFMLLSIASSGNGFIVGAVGCILLMQQNRWRLIPLWILALGLAGLAYFHHYTFVVPQASFTQSKTHLLSRLNPSYALSYLGSSLSGSISYRSGLCFGVVLCGVVLAAYRKRYFLTNPAAFYSMIFLLMTGCAVSATRSGFGIEQSLASRYRIYSNLLLILSYIFIVETYWYSMKLRRQAFWTGIAMVLLCAGFCMTCDIAGYRFLRGRREAVQNAMEEWRSPERSPLETEQHGDSAIVRQTRQGLYKPVPEILASSASLGIYRP